MVRMDEYCSSVRDGTHDTPKPTSDGKYLVTSKAIHDNTVDFSSCYFISQKDFDKINARSKVDKWDVLMTMIGSVGRLLLVQNEPNYAIKNIALFKIGNEDKAKWLYFYLSNKPVQDYFEAVASGTSQHFIGLGHLRKLKIADFNENSKKIVSILSAYDNLIENNNKRIKILEQMAENLYKEWFVRFRFPGHETTTLENGIPKGWSEEKAEDVFDISIGKTPPRKEFDCFTSGDENSVNWISISDMKDLFIMNTDEQLTKEAVEKYNVVKIPSDTVVLSFKLTVGRVAITYKESTTNEAIAHFKNSNKNMREYLYLMLKDYDYTKLGNTSAIGNAVNSKIVKAMKMAIPEDCVLNKFHSVTFPIFEEIRKIAEQNQNLIKQRDLLLPRLMSGKLAV